MSHFTDEILISRFESDNVKSDWPKFYTPIKMARAGAPSEPTSLRGRQ